MYVLVSALCGYLRRVSGVVNHEEAPNSLLIVRPQPPSRSQSQEGDSYPLHSHSQPAHPEIHNKNPPRLLSQPPATSTSQPPTKKFKANAHLHTTTGSQSKVGGGVGNPSDTEHQLDSDVRAMDDEADRLRRVSRARMLAPSLIPSTSTSNVNTSPQFPAQTPGPGHGRTRKSRGGTVDMTAPLPEEDTPRIERNKQLRAGAMAAIVNGRGREPEATTTTATPSRTGHRRKSSVSGRGKRVSSSFEATGIISEFLSVVRFWEVIYLLCYTAQPHNSVSESSFYKHIDTDLPDSERIRQLLIWCSLRAAASSSSSSSTSKLPPLSAEGVQALKASQEDIVRGLAERKVDMSMYSSEGRKEPQQGELRENEQNVRNRMWEVTYTSHIQQYVGSFYLLTADDGKVGRAQAEEEAWKKVSYGYEAYMKQLQGSLEARSADLLQGDSSGSGMSAKAKGKRRATGNVDTMLPEEHELCPTSQTAFTLVKSVLGMHHPTGADGKGRRGVTRSGRDREEVEAEIERLMPGLEYTLDQIYSWMSAAKATTDIAERVLNEKFDILGANLASRVNPFPSTRNSEGSGSETGQQLLSKYVLRERVKTVGPDPADLMRALSRVDEERPPAKVGEAARRAAREVQRAGEAGFAGSVGGEKKLTTPRKMTPGTPRRGNTPGR